MMRLSPRLALPSPSLHTKLMLALVILVAIVAGTSAYALVAHERQRRLTALEERATRIADLFSQSLAQPLWNIELGAINEGFALLASGEALRTVVSFAGTAQTSPHRNAQPA